MLNDIEKSPNRKKEKLLKSGAFLTERAGFSVPLCGKSQDYA